MSLRSRTVRGIRNDLRGMYPDILCPLGCGDVDTLQNVLTCSVLKQYHTSKEVTDRNVEYNDIYSEDIFKQQKVTELYNQLLDVRNKVIQSTPVAYHWSRAWLPSHAKSFMILGIKISI